jgi:UDP-N-acetylmuramoyl-L-alanyl-D-glutamate--2,6-diaminopimelate ligase
MVKLKADSTSLWFCGADKSYMVNMKMIGSFNVANAVCAIGVCLNLGFSIDKILTAVADCHGVKGRCEAIPTGRDFSVICDYAHTPDAIENILKSVKEYTTGRLICLFGCGGNRDKTKRPKMAAAACKYADMLIVTSDNPRDEEPSDIIKDILVGVDEKTEYITIEDRIEAIYKAVAIAKTGDVIVLAGKGHEDYQILKDNKHIHMDEREIVKEGLERL